MVSTDQRMINKFYSRCAGSQYETMMHAHTTPEIRTDFIRMLNISQEDKVIEIGVGTGVNIQFYPNGAFYFGLDINEKMLSKAAESSRLHNKKVKLVKGNAREIPFSNDSFDVAFLSYALSGIPDNLKAISEVRRIVRPGGKIGILDFERAWGNPNTGFANLDLQDIVDSLAFNVATGLTCDVIHQRTYTQKDTHIYVLQVE